jgi:hypothetical protein
MKLCCLQKEWMVSHVEPRPLRNEWQECKMRGLGVGANGSGEDEV